MYDTIEYNGNKYSLTEAYNMDYQLVVDGGLLYYIDSEQNRHNLPVSGLYIGVDFNRKTLQSSQMVFVFDKGVLRSTSLVTISSSLPTIPAMEADDEKSSQAIREGIERLTLKLESCPLKDRALDNLKRAMRCWEISFESFYKGFVTLFGVR